MGHTEDVLAILALQSDYARGADSFDGGDSGARRVEHAVGGTAAIAKLMDDTFAQQTHNMHMTMNQRVTSVDGDVAEGWCYFFQRSVLTNGGRTEFAGRYDDSYRRTPDGWRISRRVLVELLPTVLEGYEVPNA